MSPDKTLRRPLLLTCIVLALSGVASAAPIQPYTEPVRPGGRSEGVEAPVLPLHPVEHGNRPTHVESVFNCADSGVGSLRNAVAAAVDGDTIDLTQLPCSTISLTTGAIVVPQGTLQIRGPGPSLRITQDDTTRDRIIFHTGNGILTLAGLSFTNGRTPLSGGCLYSTSDLSLDNVLVSGCRGGEGYSPGTTDKKGGGLYVGRDLWMSDSTVRYNACYSGTAGRAFAGGVFVGGKADISNSTIATNFATGTFVGDVGNVGGISIAGTSASVIVNSTISGNNATNVIGGVYSYEQLNLSNSTIAFNTAASGETTAVGMYAYNGLAINSTIVANNTWAGNEFDLYGFQVTGANNLIMGSNDSPPGTLTADPQLQPLGFNGGPTVTHAIPAGSPAVDAGNNAAGVATDQRGAGFVRVYGPHVDIGAFELQPVRPDDIFRYGFDGPE